MTYDVWKRDANALRRYAEEVLRFVRLSEQADRHSRLATTIIFTRLMSKVAERAYRRWVREFEARKSTT